MADQQVRTRPYGARIFALLLDGPISPRGAIDLLDLPKVGSTDTHVKRWLDALVDAGAAHVTHTIPLKRSAVGTEPVYALGPKPCT